MTILKFEGIVKEYDQELDSENIYSIGGVDFISIINDTNFKGPVTVALADEQFSGDLYSYEGSQGYSEWTPGDTPELQVGPHNILEILSRYEDKVITLWIADESINTLE